MNRNDDRGSVMNRKSGVVCSTRMDGLFLEEVAMSDGGNSAFYRQLGNEDGMDCGPVTIRMDRSDVLPIEMCVKNVCIRQVINGRILDEHMCRTVLRKVSKEEVEYGIEWHHRGGVHRVKCVKHTRIGMFHNRLNLRLEINGNGNDGEELESEEAIEVMEVQSRGHAEVSRGRRRRPRESMNINGGRTGSGRIVRRRSRRRIGRVEDFRLFDQHGGIVGARNGASANRNLAGRSEKEKFDGSLVEAVRCIDNLDLTWNATPYFRCSGVRRRNQKFVCAATFRTRTKAISGDTISTVIVSIVIEEESKKIRDVNFKRRRRCSNDGEGTVLVDNVTFCSCDIVWENNGIGNSTCWHVEAMRRNGSLMNKVERLLDHGIEEQHTFYFGEVVLGTEMGRGRCRFTIVERESGVERPIDDGDDGDGNSIVAIQLDTMTAENLTARGNRIGKRWSPWKVIDMKEAIMTTVLWRPVSNGVAETRMMCVMCRSSQARKCKHELECERVSRANVEYGHASSIEYDDDVGEVGDVGEVEVNLGRAEGGGSGEVLDDGVEEITRSERQGVDPEDPDDDDGPEAEIEAEPVGFQRRAMNNSKEFYPTNVKRSFMLCDREQKIAENLVDMIEKNVASEGCLLFSDPIGTQCSGIYVNARGEHCRCDVLTEVCKQGQPRKVTIFTLNHGALTAVLLDWICRRCGFENKYKGYAHGLFPAAYGVVYTVELMYWFMHEMCYTTNSFRAVYASSTKLRFTPSYQRKFATNRINVLMGTHKANRRTANEAIRKFIEQIDVEGEAATEKLYTCPTCEVSMEKNDFIQLGLDEELYKEAKRLKGIVIDAKCVPLLKEGKKEQDIHDVLHSVPGLTTKIITNRDRQNSIRLFFKAVKWAISHRKNQTVATGVSGGSSSNNSSMDYMFTNGLFHIRLGVMSRQATTKTQRQRSKVLEYIKIIRYYIDPHCCLCDGSQRTACPDHQVCLPARRALHRTAGRQLLTAVMGTLFKNVQYQSPVVPSDEGTEGNFGLDDSWICMRFPDFVSFENQLDSISEVVIFIVLEPLTLGFLPFHTEEGTEDRFEGRNTVTVNGTSLGIPVENIQGVQLGPGAIGNADRADEILRASVRGLATESVALHKKVTAALRTFSTCSHGTVRPNDWPCRECVDGLGEDYRAVVLQNAVLGRYVRDVTRHGERNPVFSRCLTNIVAAFIDVRIVHLEKYLSSLSNRMHPSSLTYWRQFGHCAVQLQESETTPTATLQSLQQEVNSDVQSLYVFPGRRRFRNGIQFDKLDRQDCTKNYFKGNAQIPSFMTVQCCCGHPKLLGFVILKQCESISAALSSVLTHFNVPPRRIWYDNACNTYDSALTRIPWYLRWSMLVVDRFHFTGHNCSNAFNGSLHRLLDDDRSVAAEVINAIIEKCSRHISYLEGNNVIPFMKVLFAHLNACSHIRDHLKHSDLEDDNVWELFRVLFSCSCDSCTNGTDDAFGREGDGVSIFTRENQVASIRNGNIDVFPGGSGADGDNGDNGQHEPE